MLRVLPALKFWVTVVWPRRLFWNKILLCVGSTTAAFQQQNLASAIIVRLLICVGVWMSLSPPGCRLHDPARCALVPDLLLRSGLVDMWNVASLQVLLYWLRARNFECNFAIRKAWHSKLIPANCLVVLRKSLGASTRVFFVILGSSVQPRVSLWTSISHFFKLNPTKKKKVTAPFLSPSCGLRMTEICTRRPDSRKPLSTYSEQITASRDRSCVNNSVHNQQTQKPPNYHR